MNVVRRFNRSLTLTRKWLGPQRTWAFFWLLAITGLISLMLNAVRPQPEWVRVAQSVLVVLFLFGTAFIVLSRFRPEERRQFLGVVAPTLLAVSIGILVPNVRWFFTLVGLGWMAVALFMLRGRARQEYQAAIKHMRNNEYPEAIKVISGVIDAEPENADHYRFRAELFRLSGKIKRARNDYQKVIELTPESGVGYNGMAEVYLQDDEFEEALGYAKKALDLEPDHWVAPYNLGMIEDRLGHSQHVIEHLNRALDAGVPDSRHRMLIHLWLARAQMRLGNRSEATAELDKLKREKTGLEEWATIFESEAAAVLRRVLEDDVKLATALAEGQAELDVLAGAPS